MTVKVALGTRAVGVRDLHARLEIDQALRVRRDGHAEADERNFDGHLEIFRLETGVLRYARQHARSNFVAVVKSKHKIRPAGTRKCFVRSGLAFERPTTPVKSCEYSRGLRRRPRNHALAMPIEFDCGL